MYVCWGAFYMAMNDQSKKVKEIFLEAEGILNPLEQQRFLERACVGDPDLLGRVQRLLEAHQEGADFIPMDPQEQTKVSEEPAPREGEGSIIGPYKLLQNIGEGGCGVVYMAEQQKPVIRRVALKIIKLGMDTKQVIARFEAERQALAMMEHPNIAKVLDAGATENGRPYFVMELVRGVPITEFCDQQNLNTNERLMLFMDVCSAIQHAHQKGVIHRDIKPSNILVTMHDHKAVPKIIDFGIAKATQQRLTDKTLFTQFHQFMGTPAYMSPEQAQMSGLDIDTRTDIYSLGVLLYELLTGRTPLDAKELTKADYDEMRRRIRDEEPIYPSTQLTSMNVEELTSIAKRRNTEPSRLNRVMRGELDWIVMKALEKDRNRRYETAAEMALDVQRYLNFEPVKAAAPSSMYRFRKFAHRNKAAISVAAIILLLLSVGSVVSTWLAVKATIAQKNADQHAQESKDARELAELREQDANEQRNFALTSARALRQNLYASDMYQAQQFLEADNIAKSRELLLKYTPENADAEDLRGFEWQYLWDRCRGDQLYVFEDLSRPVGAVSFSRDGEMLVGFASDGKVGVWNVSTRMQIAQLDAEFESWPANLRVKFSSDNRFLYAGRIGGRWNSMKRAKLIVWRTDTWEQVACLKEVGFPLIEQEKSDKFAAYNGQGFHLYDIGREGDRPLDVSSHPFAEKHVRGYAFSEDDRLLALKERNDESISIFDTLSGMKLADWPLLSSTRTHLISVANGMQYVAWMSDPFSRSAIELKLRLFNPFEEREIELEQSQPGMLFAAEFSPDAQWLVAGGWDYLLHVWEASSGKKIGAFKGHLDEIFSLAISPNSQTFASGGKDGRVYLWDLRAMSAKPKMERIEFVQKESQANKITSLQGLAEMIPSALLSEFEKGNIDYFLPAGRSWGRNIVSSDGQHGACRVGEDEFELYDMIEGKFEATLQVDERQGGFSRTGPEFISNQRLIYQRDDRFSIWNVRDNRNEPASIPEEYESFLGASPDGRYLALSRQGEGSDIAVWDFDAGREVSLLTGMNYAARSVTFSSDGALVMAAGSWDKRGLVWNTLTGQVEHILTGHKQGIHAAAFSHDGRSVATYSPDGTVRIWHMETGREMLSFQPEGGANERLDRLQFSKDNQKLFIIGNDNAWVIKVPSLELIDEEISTKQIKEKSL